MINNKNTIYVITLLTLIWIILCENFALPTIGMGIAVAIGCVYFCHHLLPLPEIDNISFFKWSFYPFYLVGQIYLSGFNAIKLILTGATVEIVQIRTEITNEFLRTVLANSITLTPGTVSLEQKDDAITVLWLKGCEKESQPSEDPDALIKGNLERKLLSIQK